MNLQADLNIVIAGELPTLKHKIGLVHITELHRVEYPWLELFTLLKSSGYEGFTLAEIPGCDSLSDSVRVMSFYRALWSKLNHT
jgi:hypothetical protein